MTRVELPAVHGNQHASNGSDPIPGIGAGGGELGWEDVGTAGAGGGIKFDNHEIGGSLWIETNVPYSGVPGTVTGIYIHDTTVPVDPYGTEILLHCEHGPISLYSTDLRFGPNIMNVSSAGFSYQGQTFGVGLQAYGGRLLINNPSGHYLAVFTTETADRANDGKFEIWRDDGVFPLTPIFRVTQNGTYHIKTGATWVADL